jgi:polyisoprenoid-binding protein YceI
MKKNLIIVLIFLFGTQFIHAQKFFTRTGQVSFHSRALLEDIDAYNNQATFVMDLTAQKIQMAVLIKAFQFEKALMQEHFNENYMESDQYPKASFSGTFSSGKTLDLSRDGTTEPVNITGEITIRGITRPVSTSAVFSVTDGRIVAQTTFNLNVADFNISIPAIVRDKIAREVEVKVSLELEEM